MHYMCVYGVGQYGGEGIGGGGWVSRAQKSHSKQVNYIQSLSFSSLSSNYPVTLKMGHVH